MEEKKRRRPGSNQQEKAPSPSAAARAAEDAVLIQHNYHDYSHLVAPSHEIPSAVQPRSMDPFPVRLHFLLELIQRDSLDNVVAWQPHGRCFVVHKSEDFDNLVLPRYFNVSKFTSFRRQLNLYGFQRITQGMDKGGYYHELFLRGKIFLAHQMIRTPVKGTGVRGRANPAQEPNFWSMIWMPSFALSAKSADIRREYSSSKKRRYLQDPENDEDDEEAGVEKSSSSPPTSKVRRPVHPVGAPSASAVFPAPSTAGRRAASSSPALPATSTAGRRSSTSPDRPMTNRATRTQSTTTTKHQKTPPSLPPPSPSPVATGGSASTAGSQLASRAGVGSLVAAPPAPAAGAPPPRMKDSKNFTSLDNSPLSLPASASSSSHSILSDEKLDQVLPVSLRASLAEQFASQTTQYSLLQLDEGKEQEASSSASFVGVLTSPSSQKMEATTTTTTTTRIATPRQTSISNDNSRAPTTKTFPHDANQKAFHAAATESRNRSGGGCTRSTSSAQQRGGFVSFDPGGGDTLLFPDHHAEQQASPAATSGIFSSSSSSRSIPHGAAETAVPQERRRRETPPHIDVPRVPPLSHDPRGQGGEQGGRQEHEMSFSFFDTRTSLATRTERTLQKMSNNPVSSFTTTAPIPPAQSSEPREKIQTTTAGEKIQQPPQQRKRK